MTHKARGVAMMVAAISVIAVLQLPALAHHKESHQGGGPSPSPSPTPSASPSPTPTPTPGDDVATPCATIGPVDETRQTRLTCSAVSADGTLEIRGSVVEVPSTLPEVCLWDGCYWWADAGFKVGVDTGTGFQMVCWGFTDARTVWGLAESCEGTHPVPVGTLVECIILADVGDVSSWSSGVAEVSCF